jgi:hypothetical protein
VVGDLIGCVSSLFPLLLFWVGADSIVFVGTDPTGTDHFAVEFCLVFGVETKLTMFLYHLVFPPGLGGNGWGEVT